jgi:peptide/nickel transport system permease protein
VMWIVAIPIGVYSAVNQYSLGDQIMTGVAFIGMGMPNFLLALLILFFAVVVLDADITGLFSREFRDASWSLAKVWDLLKHLWMPALISSITGSAGLIRIMRANLLDTLGQPFVEAARARGLKNRSVIWKHAVRIAINPLVVIFGSEHIPGIINRNMLLAYILNLPTIGPVFIQALTVQDSYMAGTCLVFLVVLTLAGNLLADIGLAWLDPRIRLE